MKTFYIDKETKKQLEYLCKTYGVSQKDMIKGLIGAYYENIYNINKNPEKVFIDAIGGFVKLTKEIRKQLTNKEKVRWNIF